jgi:hypothetical protein
MPRWASGLLRIALVGFLVVGLVGAELLAGFPEKKS